MEGFLLKWVNYLFGWRRRYFILHNGVLYYCTDKGQKSKGVIHLDIAQVVPHSKNDRRIIIDTGCTEVHLKAETSEERRKWLAALREEQTHLAIETETKELRDSVPGSEDSKQQEMSEIAGNVWNLQAQLEAQIDLLSDNFRKSPEIAAIFDLSNQLKTSVTHLMAIIEDQQLRLSKLTNVLRDRESLLSAVTEEADILHSAQRYGALVPFDPVEEIEEIEFKDANSHASDDLFYDAKEEMTLFQADSDALKPSRGCLPYLRNPNQKINLWAMLRDTIGQELSKIAVPVYFNEPLSFLQRFSEDFTYSDLLTYAADQSDPCIRLAYVTTWLVSQYSFTVGRTMKPFNPVLGETFELETHGFHLISEQVSHHPPISAVYCDHEKFQSWGCTEVKSSFKGTSLLVSPTGVMHLVFKQWNEHISWTKPQTSVHNMIIGKVYVDHHGLLRITNNTTGEYCTLHIKKLGWFDKNPHCIEATIFDTNGIVRYSLHGKWDRSITLRTEATGEERVIWQMAPFPEGYENNYFFTNFTLQLNIPPEAYHEPICPTDSRYRPDQRALENGDIRLATGEKLRIEEKQREARKQRSEVGEMYQPRWFEERDGEWRYSGGYWEEKTRGQFERCPDIF